MGADGGVAECDVLRAHTSLAAGGRVDRGVEVRRVRVH